MKETELNENMELNMDILDKIYETRQNVNYDRKELACKLNNITIEEVETIIKKDIEEQHKKQEIIEKLDKLIENYEIKMAYYMEKGYKQGFKDGVNLIKQCDK